MDTQGIELDRISQWNQYLKRTDNNTAILTTAYISTEEFPESEWYLPDEGDIILDVANQAFWEDFYFVAGYPGDNFVVVDRETKDKCVEITDSVIKKVLHLCNNVSTEFLEKFRSVWKAKEATSF